MKKVLFISPTPTHESNAGNRLHIKSLVSFFKDHQCEVDFLYFQYEVFDKKTMFAFFENRLTVVPREILYSNKKTVSYIKRKFIAVNKRIQRRWQHLINKISTDQFLYNSEVDSHFPHFAKKIIEEQARIKKYEIVVCEYAAMSKALTCFGKNVFKILDTHDVFTDRFQVYLTNQLKPEWVSLFKDQESKALKRADLVLAVQGKDKALFSKMCKADIGLYNFVPEPVELPTRVFEQKLLYIASGNYINLATIEYFIKEIFPVILASFPQTKLLIGGNICERITTSHPNILLTGKCADIKDFYAMGDIVINPEISGTGYKVKALEALAHGMPLVSTLAGATGAVEPFKNHLFLVDTVHEFSSVIINIFKEPEMIRMTSLNARQWIIEYKQIMDSNLLEKLPLKAYS